MSNSAPVLWNVAYRLGDVSRLDGKEYDSLTNARLALRLWRGCRSESRWSREANYLDR